MKPLLPVALVGLGGALGAVARWKLGGLVLHHTADWKFPLSTFLVNVLGCLVAGVLSGLVIKQHRFGPETQLFLFTGLLGGFTTFSAFGLDTVALLRHGDHAIALTYAVSSVIAGVLALWIALACIPGGNS
jgi:CrcB protein